MTLGWAERTLSFPHGYENDIHRAGYLPLGRKDLNYQVLGLFNVGLYP